MSKEKSLKELFTEKYPDLPKQLEEMEIKDWSRLDLEVFVRDKPKYFHEMFDYSLKDNEKILNIMRTYNSNRPKGFMDYGPLILALLIAVPIGIYVVKLFFKIFGIF